MFSSCSRRGRKEEGVIRRQRNMRGALGYEVRKGRRNKLNQTEKRKTSEERAGGGEERRGGEGGAGAEAAHSSASAASIGTTVSGSASSTLNMAEEATGCTASKSATCACAALAEECSG